MPTIITVGELCATHLGQTLTITAPVGLNGATETFTDTLARVQHDGPHDPPEGDRTPARTLVAVGSWSGPLDPTHPVEVG
ncbi:hypothetical protein [Janibacter terrae]|uniref:hypothetical protein n=1 Tax=Janibacter terrae TaxID=103817 RepID=UPI0031F99541